jgi:hypothetical protein
LSVVPSQLTTTDDGPLTNNMAENQEKIEGRLCEYIEGTLDATGVAEIEKHLASNPQHRRLLDELMRSRALMRQLPRTGAPAEINEHLQAQLERAALLGDLAEEMPRESMRISPWPRIRAVAAVLLLAAGLGAVIYFVLPGARPSGELAQLKIESAPPTTIPSEELALRGPLAASIAVPTTGPSLALAVPAPSGIAGGSTDALLRDRARATLDAVRAPGAPAAPGPSSVDATVSSTTVDSTLGVAGTAAEAADATRALADAGLTREQLQRNGVGPNLVPIILRTDNPTLANVEVERYFNDNKISFECVAKSAFLNEMPAAGAASAPANVVSQTTNAYPVNAPGANASNSAASAAAEKQQEAAKAELEKSALQGQKDQSAGAALNQQPQQKAASEDERAEARREFARDAEKTDNKTTVAAQQAQVGQHGYQWAQQQQQEALAKSPGTAAPGEQLYIARRLTRRQAVDLNNSLLTNSRAVTVTGKPARGMFGGTGATADESRAQTRDRYGVELRGWPVSGARGATTMTAAAAAGGEVSTGRTASTTQPALVAPESETSKPPAVAAAAPPPTTGEAPIQPGETIELKIGQHGGPAVVADDGKVLLPTGDIVTAAGLTPSALEKELRSKLVRSKVPPEVSVTRVPPPSEADRFAADFAMRSAGKGAANSGNTGNTGNAANGEPTTHPAGEMSSTTDEDRVDVVIVVRNEAETPLQQTPSQVQQPDAASEAAPSTQPAAAQPGAK